MNIFVLDKNPLTAATMLCDKHIIKMAVEASQMLCNCYDQNFLQQFAPLTTKGTPRKHSHYNHPCSKWARMSENNFRWLLINGIGICDEHIKRFGGDKTLTRCVLYWCRDNMHNLYFSQVFLTPFALCMPDEYKSNDAVVSYRNFYLEEKRNIAEWKLGNEPVWWKK